MVFFFGSRFGQNLGNTSALYNISAGVNLSAVFSGIWVGQEKSKKALCVLHLCTFIHGLFSLCGKSGLPHGHLRTFRTSHMASHFQMTTLQEVKEDIADLILSYRKYT